MSFQDLFSKSDDKDIRSALYYTARYIKQVDNFDEYGKDIFEDEERSYPSEIVKSLSSRLIEHIEKREGKTASLFSHEETIRILDELTDFEETLTPDPSEDDLKQAERFAADMALPPLKQ